MKGLARTAARAKEAPGEFTLKVLAFLAPSLLGYLLADGTLKRAVETLFFDGKEPQGTQRQTLAGNLHNTLAWEEAALKNISPYTRLNYFTVPLWMSADRATTLSLKYPIHEEAKPFHLALAALLNRSGLDTGMPAVGLPDLLAQLYGNLAPPSTPSPPKNLAASSRPSSTPPKTTPSPNPLPRPFLGFDKATVLRKAQSAETLPSRAKYNSLIGALGFVVLRNNVREGLSTSTQISQLVTDLRRASARRAAEANHAVRGLTFSGGRLEGLTASVRTTLPSLMSVRHLRWMEEVPMRNSKGSSGSAHD